MSEDRIWTSDAPTKAGWYAIRIDGSPMGFQEIEGPGESGEFYMQDEPWSERIEGTERSVLPIPTAEQAHFSRIAVEMLGQSQWTPQWDGDGGYHCQWCKGEPAEGHADECALAAVLRELKETS